MKKGEFVKLCFECGYTTKAQAEKWVEENPREEYTDDDFIQAHYRFTLDCGSGQGSPYLDSHGGTSTKSCYKDGGLSFVH